MAQKSVGILGKFPPTCGQVSTLNLWLALGLAGKGWRVTVCSDARFRVKRVVAHDDEDLTDYVSHPNIRLVYPEELADRLFMPFSELAFVSYLSGALEAFCAEPPDVIFSHYLEPYALAGHIISQHLGIPHVVTHAGSDVGRLCSDAAVERVFQIVAGAGVYIPKNRNGLRLSDNGPRPSVQAYWPPPEVFRYAARPSSGDAGAQPTSEEPTFGFYGKFVHGKALDRILDAFKKFRARNGVGKLFLVGGDIGGSFEIDGMIEARGLKENIALPGFLPNWKIPAFINRCDAMIYMKDEYMTGQHASIVLRELISCSASVICTDESRRGLSPEQSEGALLHVIDPSSVEDLCSAMEGAAGEKGGERLGFDGVRAHQAFIRSWEATLVGALN